MSRWRRKIFRILLALAVTFGAVWLSGVRLFGFSGDSMTPTVRPGDFFVGLTGLWGRREPRRFDLIIFEVPPSSKWARQGIPWMKRVVGLPRERVRLAGAELFIDGRRLDAPFLHLDRAAPPRKDFEVTLGDDEYFVLGDNLDHTLEDSRALGPIRGALIKGRVGLVFHATHG